MWVDDPHTVEYQIYRGDATHSIVRVTATVSKKLEEKGIPACLVASADGASGEWRTLRTNQ